MSWFDANTHCASIGKRLASIMSQEENDQIKDLIENAGKYF